MIFMLRCRCDCGSKVQLNDEHKDTVKVGAEVVGWREEASSSGSGRLCRDRSWECRGTWPAHR